MTKLTRKEIKAAKLAQHVRDAGRKAQKGVEPNDRKYSVAYQKQLRRMSPHEIDDLLNGED